MTEYMEICIMEKEVMDRADLSAQEKLDLIFKRSMEIEQKHALNYFGTFEDFHRNRGGIDG